MSETNITEQTIHSLIDDLRDTRKRTLELIAGLDEQQIIGPKLDIVNPLLWEIGHAAYFHELWTLRHLDGDAPFLENADELYDSISISHADRWNLPLLSLDDTRAYMQQVLDAEISRLKNKEITALDVYLTRYAVFHEDMHTEAYTYSRRTLNYPAPAFANTILIDENYDTGPLEGDVEIEGGRFLLGANKESDFCFDNEKWQHPVNIATFSIAKAATSYQQYAAFVDDGGYQDQQYWDQEGWNWLQENNMHAPDGWKKDADENWLIREFDQWAPMRAHAAVIHINWYEASAWCQWAKRRLPSEAEWELAASGTPGNINEKRKYPWGKEPPTERHVNMNARAMRTIDVSALPAGDSAYGCRQMLGNVWEWTADTFNPYPGFIADMYQDYSQPLFGQTKVLRGGAWPTRSRMMRNTWRNYYGPDRNDVFAGFRSCAL